MNISTRTIVKVLSVTGVFLLALFLAYATRRELTWLVTSFALALALNPLVVKTQPYMPGKNRSWAVTTVVVALIAAATLFAIILVPPIVSQSEKLVQNLPHYTDELLSSDSTTGRLIRHYHLVQRIQESQDQLLASASSAGLSLVGLAKDFFTSAIAAVTILVLTIFMMNEGPAWRRRFYAFLSPRQRHHLEPLAAEMYHAVTSYATGKLIMSLTAAIPTAILLAVLDVPYAISLGIVVGLFDLLPLIGATLGAIVVLVVCLFTSTTAAIVMLIFFLIFQQVENHIIQPIVFNKSVAISPLLVIVSVLLGAAIGNILGALIAIPLTASIQILVKDYLAHRPVSAR